VASRDGSSRAQRAEERRRRAAEWPVRSYRLGEEPVVDPLDRSTVDERLASMWPLARTSWILAGREIPDYERSETPGVVIRPTGTE